MQTKIFYSWQSDLPNSTNRGFIEVALQRAAKTLRADESILVEPVVDRDTANVPGSPEITRTIFDKIDEASVFIADVSIINQGVAGRMTPNPNVLIELGYAAKTLGWSNIVLVMNTAYGVPEQLPFDLRMRRIIPYTMPDGTPDKAGERGNLERRLTGELRVILAQVEELSLRTERPLWELVVEAVERQATNRTLLARNLMESLCQELVRLDPDLANAPEQDLDEPLVQAIAQTEGLVQQLAKLSEIVATSSDGDVAAEIYRGFECIARHYYLPQGVSGSYRRVQFDLFKFAGHELFVTFFSYLLREGRWEIMADLLDTELYVENARSDSRKTVSYAYLSSRVDLLEFRNTRLRLNRISVHADILNERHKAGGTADVVPAQQFMAADFLLFLRSRLTLSHDDRHEMWRAWSALYLNSNLPRFLVEARRYRQAEKLLPLLGVATVEELRNRFKEMKPRLEDFLGQKMFYGNEPLTDFNPEEIGSK